MGIYNYACKDCEHEFDEMLKMDDRKIPEGKPCPKCGKEGTVYQQIGRVNMVHQPGSRLKVDNGFREVQQKIAATHRKHTMNIH